MSKITVGKIYPFNATSTSSDKTGSDANLPLQLTSGRKSPSSWSTPMRRRSVTSLRPSSSRSASRTTTPSVTSVSQESSSEYYLFSTSFQQPILRNQGCPMSLVPAYPSAFLWTLLTSIALSRLTLSTSPLMT